MKTSLTLLTVGLLGLGIASSLEQRRRQRLREGVRGEPLQRWEGEGGNVPAANPALKAEDAEGAAPTAPVTSQPER